MNGRTVIDAEMVPRLAPHMKLRFDQARQTWTIQAPERSFLLDGVAEAIVSRCDGKASIAAVINSLCAAFPAAPRQAVETDVMKLIQDFVDKGVMLP